MSSFGLNFFNYVVQCTWIYTAVCTYVCMSMHKETRGDGLVADQYNYPSLREGRGLHEHTDTRGLHRSKHSCPNPKRTRNVGLLLDQTIIWKLEPQIHAKLSPETKTQLAPISQLFAMNNLLLTYKLWKQKCEFYIHHCDCCHSDGWQTININN